MGARKSRTLPIILRTQSAIGSRSDIRDFLNDIGHVDCHLSREEECRLALLAAAGDRDSEAAKAAADKLIESQLPFIVRLASDIHRDTFGPGAEFGDLVQHGCLSLLKFLPRFDPKRGRLSTCTAMVVKQKMIQYAWQHRSTIYRPANPSIFSKRNRVKADQAAYVASLDALERPHGGDEDEDGLTTPPEFEFTSGANGGGNGNNGNSDPGEPTSIELAELLAILRREIDRLPAREQIAIRGKMEGLTLEQIGVRLGGVTRERARQIEFRGMQKLREAMLAAV